MAAGATPSLEYGGFEYDFVDTPPERLLCKICKEPSRDPYMTLCCGHAFCKSCLDRQKQARTICYACPMCRKEEPDFKTVPYVALNREIRELHVYCANKEKGCKWQGEINNINNHLYSCQLGEVKCSNECGKMIQRQYLTSHVETECPHRKVNCQYCHDTGEHQFIEGQHKEECPKLPLPCPNKCEVGSVPREDMEAHRKECPLEVIQCEYYSVGCEVRIIRKDLEKHMLKQMEEHLVMMTQSSMQKLLDNPADEQFSELGATCEVAANDLPFDLPITRKQSSTIQYHSVNNNEVHRTELSHYSDMSSTTMKDLTSAKDALPAISHAMTDRLPTSVNDPTTANYESTKPKELSSTDDDIPTFNTEEDISIRNELAATQKQLFKVNNEVLSIKEDMFAVKKVTEQTIETQTKFSTEVKYIQDKQQQKINALEATLNCVAQQVQLGPWGLRLLANLHNEICPVIVMIPNIDNKKRHNGKWLSDPFWTHDKMYRMCLHMIINGAGGGEGTHVSVFLYLMKGEYDKRLQRPLIGSFVITLLNQKTDNNHYSMRFTEMSPLFISNLVGPNRPDEIVHAGVGCSNFISHQDLEKTSPNCQYLKDDSIFIKVEAVVTSRNFQPKLSIIHY